MSSLYESWREDLIQGLAHAEAVIDFGDDEDLEDDEGLNREETMRMFLFDKIRKIML